MYWRVIRSRQDQDLLIFFSPLDVVVRLPDPIKGQGRQEVAVQLKMTLNTNLLLAPQLPLFCSANQFLSFYQSMQL